MKSLTTSAALTIFAFAAHAAIPVSPGAVLYVANGNANTIEAITPAGVGSLFATNGLSDPFGVAFDTAGNLYVSSFNGTTVEKITPNGVATVFASGLSSPSGVAFDSAGNLYVANFGANTIEKFTPAGVGSVFASTGLDGPTGIAFDTSGNLYVANWNNNTIEKFNSSGVGSVFASTDMSEPSGIAFDTAGNLYVASYGSTTVVKFATNGVGTLFAGGLSAPSGLAFDSAGNLYVANYDNNTIDEITPAGVSSVFVSSGLNIPLMLAFAPPPGVLPELQTVQTAIKGLNVSGFVNQLIVAIAEASMAAATQPVNWVNNSQTTVNGGDTVYGGVFIAEEELEVLIAANRSNTSLDTQSQSLVSQLVAASGTLATTAITENPTSKYISEANEYLAAGDATTNAGDAIAYYYIAWALVQE